MKRHAKHFISLNCFKRFHINEVRRVNLDALKMAIQLKLIENPCVGPSRLTFAPSKGGTSRNVITHNII